MKLQELSIVALREEYEARKGRHQKAVSRYLDLKRELAEAERELNSAETSMDTVGGYIERYERVRFWAKSHALAFEDLN